MWFMIFWWLLLCIELLIIITIKLISNSPFDKWKVKILHLYVKRKNKFVNGGHSQYHFVDYFSQIKRTRHGKILLIIIFIFTRI